MSDVPFSRPGPTEECLSHYHLSQLASSGQSHDHTEGCERCAALLREELALYEAAKFETVPQSLLDLVVKDEPRRTWMRAWVPALVAACACALVVVFVQPTSHRRKGSLPVHVRIERAGKVVADDRAVESVDEPRAGDTWQFRVGSRWVRIRGLEEGRWIEYYAGAAANGGWIPVGVQITDVGETSIEIVGCKEPPSEALSGCDVRRLSW